MPRGNDVVILDEAGNRRGDWGAQILAAHADDLCVQEFTPIVEDLEPDR
jgi:hypothetical protein